MMRLSRLPNPIRIGALALLISWIATGLCRAEVGVSLQGPGGSEVQTPYILGIIVDDTEPVGSAWIAYNSDSPVRVVLNPSGSINGDGNPSVAIAPDGSSVVAWSKNSPAGYDVVVSRFVGGAWTVPEPLADSPANELDPFLVRDPADGALAVVYWVQDTTPRVMLRRASADLSSWGPPVQVSVPGEVTSRPSAVYYQGLLRVAYEVHDVFLGSTPRRIMLATEDGPGFDYEQLATSQHGGQNYPQVHSAAGTLWVDWIDGAGDMAWTRLQPSGYWDAVQSEPFTSIEGRDYHVRGAIRFHVLP